MLRESEPGSGGPCDPRGSIDRDVCSVELAQADKRDRAATTRSTIALVTAGAGVAAIGVGIVLRLTGPDPNRFERRSARVVPLTFAGGGGLGLSGAFRRERDVRVAQSPRVRNDEG